MERLITQHSYAHMSVRGFQISGMSFQQSVMATTSLKSALTRSWYNLVPEYTYLYGLLIIARTCARQLVKWLVMTEGGEQWLKIANSRHRAFQSISKRSSWMHRKKDQCSCLHEDSSQLLSLMLYVMAVSCASRFDWGPVCILSKLLSAHCNLDH